MARIDILKIKESVQTLRKLHKSSASHLRPRIQMLVLIKQDIVHTKRGLAAALGVSDRSILIWKKRYAQGGMKVLLQDERGGNKPPVITEQVHRAIEKRLSNPSEALRSYKELQQWVSEHYIKDINYYTVRKHVRLRLGAKLKVPRKSHIRKDTNAVRAFKKNRSAA